eukprot:TRINITY_DN2252_c0_g1_i3.p2 TRINITY_DN2252_c0_g1~~TRINITY_DN2252_c0_g1_i3.p2  ORF type:complete len:186 (-),score=60.76 TRINITY_DN2252_c0_g1_i3:1665-2168(-)
MSEFLTNGELAPFLNSEVNMDELLEQQHSESMLRVMLEKTEKSLELLLQDSSYLFTDQLKHIDKTTTVFNDLEDKIVNVQVNTKEIICQTDELIEKYEYLEQKMENIQEEILLMNKFKTLCQLLKMKENVTKANFQQGINQAEANIKTLLDETPKLVDLQEKINATI